PLAAAREHGVVVTNTPGVLDAAVAELAVGLLLAPERGAVVSSSLSFDATVTSLWTPLLCCGTVTLLDEGDEIAGLEAHVRNAAGLVKITPAHLD
ncbi:hypothetical protein ACR42A_36115, partial [Burkholderia gladioli]